jgi:AraC-like DNA-binding protein
MIMYYSAQKTIREEILTSNASNLNQFINIIDMELGNMTEKATQILSSTIVREQVFYNYSIADRSSGFEVYEVKNYLDDIPRDDFSDVFVYFKGNDRIISAEKSSLSSQEYYQTYYQQAFNNLLDSRNNYDTFYSALTPDTLVPHLISFGQEQTTPSLGVVLSQNTTNSLQKGEVTAVLIFQPELLERLLQNALFLSQGSILIFDNENHLLVSSDSNELDIDLSSYTDRDKICYDTIHGQEYILQFFSSKILNCSYVSAISSKVFWEKLYGLRTMSLISILLSMMISIVLSWMLARRSYSPISSIVHTIRNNSDFQYDFKKKSELDFIREVLMNSFSENDLLSSRIENSNNNLLDDFLLHAMQGTLAQYNYFEKEFENIRIHFISDSFCILLVNIDSVNEEITGSLNSDGGQRTLSLIIMNIMLELCGKSHRGFVLNLMSNVYAVVLNFSQNTLPADKLDGALDIGQSFQSFIKQYFNITSTISVSYPTEGIYNINNAYRQALEAMEYRYLIGKGSLIPYKDITEKKFTYNNSFNSKNTQILIQYVKENNQEDISTIVNGIIDNSILDNNSSLRVIECFKYDLINTINKIIFEIGAVDFEKEKGFLSSLINAETFDEFKVALKSALWHLRIYWEESKEQFTICDKAEALIHNCYMDVNLNNSIIADKLNISPSYLSKLFKNQKNISLLDYLYQVRLSYAKTFLKETNLTVEEIAAKTGFISNSSLTKTFKKYEGITPGSYRKLSQ